MPQYAGDRDNCAAAIAEHGGEGGAEGVEVGEGVYLEGSVVGGD